MCQRLFVGYRLELVAAHISMWCCGYASVVLHKLVMYTLLFVCYGLIIMLVWLVVCLHVCKTDQIVLEYSSNSCMRSTN